MPRITIPFKTHEHIKKIAEDFLQKYHPQDTCPIPIEEIIEFQLGVDIIPVPGLHETIDTDGFISSDLASISIDEYVYKKRVGRYRFTLAHEIGHAVMHKGVYGKRGFNTTTEWKRFMEDFPEKEWSLLEWQANEFAGLVLVPVSHLYRRAKHHAKEIKSLGIDDEDVILDRVIELLSKDFVVSREVIQRRINKELKSEELL